MTVLNRGLLILAAIVIAGCEPTGVAEEEWRFPTDRITKEQWQIYRDETLAMPGVRAYEAANQLIVEALDGLTIYVFTTPAHPAHPGVVKRQVMQRGGAFYIRRQGHYAGDPAAYDVWWRQFDELDRQMRESIEQGKGQ